MAPPRRMLRLFARGNVDVRDTLLWSKVGGVVEWNGINELLRTRRPGTLFKIRHETCARLDLLPLPGETLPAPPAEVACALPNGGHPIARQHTTSLFDDPYDVVVLSIQSAATNALVRHRRDGWLMLPDDLPSWDAASRAFLRDECENAGLIPLETAMQRLEALVLSIEERLGAHVLVFNLSPITPGERIHCWTGTADSLSLRTRRFNVALADLSAKLGFSIVDVDRVVACAGAEKTKVDLFHLNPTGWRLVADEVIHVLEERGAFDVAESPA